VKITVIKTSITKKVNYNQTTVRYRNPWCNLFQRTEYKT